LRDSLYTFPDKGVGRPDVDDGQLAVHVTFGFDGDETHHHVEQESW